jgi:hypothetical protein
MIQSEIPLSAKGLPSALSDIPGATARGFSALVGHNMGNTTLIFSLPMQAFYEMSEVANELNIRENPTLEGQEVAQRKLDKNHAASLGTYILKGLLHALAMEYTQHGKVEPEALNALRSRLGKQPYMALQPITANIRNCDPLGASLHVDAQRGKQTTVYLTNREMLWVVDGQHRRFAMQLVHEFLRHLTMIQEYPKRLALFPATKEELSNTIPPAELAIWNRIFELWRTSCTLTVEAHLGLTPEQERQLFHDLNNLTKKIESSQVHFFDSSNPVNVFIKDVLEDGGSLGAKIAAKDVANWHDDPGAITRKDLVGINAVLFLNKTNIRSAKPADVETREEVATRFWETVSRQKHFGENGARQKTVLAQPVVLKALAKLVYDFGFSKTPDPTSLEILLEKLDTVDFSHTNPIWCFYDLSMEDREKNFPGLTERLPSTEGANRDLGGFQSQEQVMRFGQKHNDIYPILGDMIRYMLKLPNRRQR